MQYCLYLRKSRADAEAEMRGEGETLARHEKILLELGKNQKLNITQIHREVVSGDTIAARPVMQQLLYEVGQGMWAGVLVIEIERLARGDTIDQGIMAQAFKYSNTKIITPVKTYDPNNEFDEEYFEFGLFMSRREYKTINRRLQRGRLASVKEGKYVGSVPPYGYERISLKDTSGFTLNPVPNEADVVRMIYEFYTKGEVQPDGSCRRIGVSLIARKLNSLHILPKKGANWVSASIRDILTNPIYMGKIRWNWRKEVKTISEGKVEVSRPRSDEATIVEGLHPAIIDEKTFNTAQQFMAKNPPRPLREKGAVKNPLAGLVMCGKCGKRMVRRPYAKKGQEPTLMCQDPHCDNVSSNLSVVERRVIDALRDWVTEYKVQWEASKPKQSNSIDSKKAIMAKLNTKLDELNKQRDNIHDLLEKGIYSTEIFIERSKRLTHEIKQCEAAIATVQADIRIEYMRNESRKNIIPAVERLLEVYYELPSATAKNNMLSEVIEKIIYTKPLEARWKNPPDNFDVTLYPHLPKEFYED